MSCQRAPRVFLFDVAADFGKVLNLTGRHGSCLHDNDVAVRVLDDSPQFGLLARGESAMERPVYFCGPPAAQQTFTDRADSV